MPYEGFADGLYLLKQQSPSKGVSHYGILDVGNRLAYPNVDQPIVVHQTPPAIRVDWLRSTGSWAVIGRIVDEGAAIGRLGTAMANPRYDLFGHNCEHFARFVATGRRESSQLQAVVAVAGIVTLMAVAGRRAA